MNFKGYFYLIHELLFGKPNVDIIDSSFFKKINTIFWLLQTLRLKKNLIQK